MVSIHWKGLETGIVLSDGLRLMPEENNEV